MRLGALNIRYPAARHGSGDRLLRAAGLFALVAYTPKTGGELGSEQKDLRGVVQPQEKRGKRGSRAVGPGLSGVRKVQADDPAADIEQDRRQDSAQHDGAPR